LFFVFNPPSPSSIPTLERQNFLKISAAIHHLTIMEGLGIAANVFAVVGLAAQVCGTVYNYIKSAKGCTETTSQLHKELLAVQTSLEGLRLISARLDDAAKSGKDLLITSQLSGALSDCSKTIKDILDDLEDTFQTDGDHESARDSNGP
jgi:hypothetical protein